MILIVTISPPGSELTWESWEGYDQAGHLWNTGLHCLKDFHMEKPLMLKISLAVYPLSCHHFGRTKPHAVTSHRSMCRAQSHIWQTCSIHVRDSSHSYFYSMSSEKKWCSTAQNGMGPQVLTAQSTCTGHARLKFWALCLWKIWPSHEETALQWPYCHGACSAPPWSCDTPENCNKFQKCPSQIEGREKAQGKGEGKRTPGAVTGEFTWDNNNLNSLSSGFCSQDHSPIPTNLVCGPAHFKTIKHQEFLVLLFTARSGIPHFCQKLSIIKLMQLLVHH